MIKLSWCLLVLMLAAMVVAFAAPPAAAAEYTNVASLKAFSAESDYMSLAGYLRWMTFKDQGVWLSPPEAQRIVAEQLKQR